MKRNIRKELAEKLYKDPTKDTFMNKTRSLVRAGYKLKTAQTSAQKYLDNVNFTDADYAKFELFLTQIPQIYELFQKKLQELATIDKISAKDFANLINYLDKLAKYAGIAKEIIEKRELKVVISVPEEVCPKCGYKRENIMEREYERRKE